MLKSRVYHLFIFLCFSVQLQAQRDTLIHSTNFELEYKMDSVIANAIQHRAFPGCVVYAARKDSVVFFKSYGYHTYDSITEVTNESIYDLASITKVVAATLALMKLYDEGLIKLDDPISNYIDGIGRKVGSVTFREALAHQGGLYPWIPFHSEARKRNGSFKRKTVQTARSEDYSYPITDDLYLHNDFYQKIKRAIKRSDISSDPTYRYSGLFFYLVPELVEKLSGISFEDYLVNNFYEPLNAQTLGFNPLDRFEQHQLVPTEIDTFFRMEPIHGKVHDEGAIMMKGVSGNAGLFSNAQDMARIWEMWLNYGIIDTTTYLRPQTVALFTTSQYPNSGNRRGLGFDKPLLIYDSIQSSVAKDASFLSYGHTGYTGTLAWADPSNDLIFIFLTNRVYPSRNARAIYDLNVRPTIHQMIYDYLKQEKIEN